MGKKQNVTSIMYSNFKSKLLQTFKQIEWLHKFNTENNIQWNTIYIYIHKYKIIFKCICFKKRLNKKKSFTKIIKMCKRKMIKYYKTSQQMLQTNSKINYGWTNCATAIYKNIKLKVGNAKF